MKDWQLVDIIGSSPAIINMNTQDTIMYVDDIDPEVIKSVCEMHNSGMIIEWISEALANNNACFTNQREFIMEQITAYEKLTNMTEGMLEPITTIHNSNGNGAQNQDKPQETLLQQKELSRGEKAAATRKANAAGKTGNSISKKQGTVDAIKMLEEKIQLIKLLDAAEVLDIPIGLTKSSRDLMTQFQKEQQDMIDSYLEKVQAL